MNMSARVSPGRFLGRTIQRRSIAGLVLADVRYPARATLQRHDHERAYFCVILRGSYTERFGRRTRVCRPGSIVFHPAGEHHSEVFADADVASFNVELGPEWLQQMYEGDVALDQPVERADDVTFAVAKRLFRAFRGGHRGSELVVESLTAEVLSMLAPKPRRSEASMPSWLLDARNHIDAHLQKPVGLRSLAAVAHVHPVHFAASFRRYFDCSPGEYLRRRRLDFVRSNLRNPDLSLAHIAEEAGFADQSHMTRAFKRFSGLAPGRYRTLLAFKTP